MMCLAEGGRFDGLYLEVTGTPMAKVIDCYVNGYPGRYIYELVGNRLIHRQGRDANKALRQMYKRRSKL